MCQLVVPQRTMTIIAEFTVPAEQFALADTLSEVPEITVEIDRVVAHEADWIVPCFWAFGDKDEKFEQAVRDDSSIKNLTKLNAQEDATLYRAEWTDKIVDVTNTLIQAGATLLEAIGQDGQWMIELRFDTPDGLTAFNRYLTETDMEAELQRLYRSGHPNTERQPCLTDVQHETLVTALENGYYQTPREITMSELADKLGISQQALSKRLRGAHQTVVENSLAIESADIDDDQES